MAGTEGESVFSAFLRNESGFLSLGGGKNAIGLCIGTSAIKLVQLKKKGKSWQLVKFSVAQLPDDAIVNREVMNPVMVADTLKALATQMKVTGKGICTGLGGPALIIKRMMVEVPNLRELQDAVFWEAEQYLPFDPAEVSMDYHMISRGKDNKTDVVFVAVKLSVMEGYTNAIESAGMKAKVVDSEFFALQNAFEANYNVDPHQAVALVDIGASSIKVVVVQSGAPIYTKDTTIGGRTLTAEIQKHLNLTYSDAEALKVGSSGPMPQEVLELVNLAAENFAVEIKRALDFYNASSSGAPVAYILLTGGSSKLPELTRIVEERTGLACQIMNVFQQVSYDEKAFAPDFIQAIGPLAATAIGFAIRGGS